MQDTAKIAPKRIPRPSDPLLAPLFALDAVVVGEVVPVFAPDEALLVLAAVLEPLGEPLAAGAAVAAAPALLTPALLNTPASTSFVHAPTTVAE